MKTRTKEGSQINIIHLLYIFIYGEPAYIFMDIYMLEGTLVVSKQTRGQAYVLNSRNHKGLWGAAGCWSMKWEKGEGQDRTLPLGDVLVCVAIEYYTGGIYKEKSLLSHCCVSRKSIMKTSSLRRTEWKDSVHLWVSMRGFHSKTQAFHVSLNLSMKAESLWLNLSTSHPATLLHRGCWRHIQTIHRPLVKWKCGDFLF